MKISSSHRHDSVSRSLQMHYSPVTFDSTSSLGLNLESIRKRTDQHAAISRNDNGIPKSPKDRREKQTGKRIASSETRKRPLSSLPSMPRSNTDRSLIDISNIDYGVYRHKIIEATLKKHYEDVQAPGDVVLNSLHLNSTDSVIDMRLDDHYDHSLFDFVEEYYDAGEMTNHEHDEHPHPLDHFLTKGMEKPQTTEKETETLLDEEHSGREDVRNHHHQSARVDNDPPRLWFDADNNGNSPFYSLPRRASFEGDSNSNPRMPGKELIPKRSRKLSAGKARCRYVANDYPRSGDLDARRESSRTTENRPASADSASKGLPKGLALSRGAALPERSKRRITRSPGASAGGSKKKLGDYPNWELPSSSERCGAMKGGPDFTSASSSEIASICSEHLQGTGTPCCSRESSISPASRALRPPWLLGNQDTSFNRKYGRTARNPAWNSARTARPMSACDDHSRKLAISSRARSNESSSAFADRGDPAPHERRTASFASWKREGIAALIERCEADSPMSPRRGTTRDRLENVEEVATRNERDGTGTRDSSGSRKRALKISRKRSVSSQDASAKRSASPNAVRADVRQNTMRLNRDSGEQRLRIAGSRVLARGGSLSPKMELSAEALSYVDDTADGSTVASDEKLAMLANEIDRLGAEKRAEVAENADESRAALNARDQPAKTKQAENDVGKSNNVDRSLAWLEVPRKIVRNSQARPASAGDLSESPRDKARPGPHPVWQDANAETKSGLSGAKLNARSNDAVDRMRRRDDDVFSLFPREESAFRETETRVWDIAANDASEKLTLPRRDSKIGLAMNCALRRYIRMLKHGLLNHSDKDGIALASLSLTDAISVLSEQKMSLSPEETQELQSILSKVERNPELLYKESLSNMENVEM